MQMEQDKKEWAHDVLTKYIEGNNCRKTAERFAILDAIYGFDECFTMENLVCKMGEQNFHVSRATIYNSLKLFVKLCLVVKHRFQTRTVYEACGGMQSHCYQECTICGKIVEIELPMLAQVINGIRLKRFRKEYYSVNFYGVCASCQKRGKRKKNNITGKSNN